eukprot:TRINITY_DN8011_c0_g1_i3.p2 TRINITY_DN8011_c0_g1~~TRINITY_DN8011_c0_g1_i3.p2  ORF type:complete len:143 (+),score=32.23 TRINITY_DN8011_c0_g1_i3:921-1349(+)
MSLFMELKDSKGEYFPTSWMRDILLNFLIAGRDTTALLLTWSTYTIVSHPHVYAKVKEESKRVLGNGVVNEEKISEMKYLKNCLKETLRLYPSVPATASVPFVLGWVGSMIEMDGDGWGRMGTDGDGDGWRWIKMVETGSSR